MIASSNTVSARSGPRRRFAKPVRQSREPAKNEWRAADLGGLAGESPALHSTWRLNAERRDANQRIEMRIGLERDRTQSAHREKEAEVEETLGFGGAEEKIAARKRHHQRRVIVMEHLRATLIEVVKVLDDERVIEVDDRRQRLAVCEERVGGVPLNDGDVVLFGRARDGLGCQAAAIGAESGHLMSVGDQHLRHLDEADADAGRLAVAERLRADEQHAGHPRPFIRSTIACSFQVRDL